MNAQPTTDGAGEADELERRFGRSAGGDQVVDEQHALAALQRIAVHLETVDAVLELVVLAEVLGGQLAAFADRHEPRVHPVRERGPDDEAARFDRGDLVDRPAVIGAGEAVDDGLAAHRDS